MEFSLLLFVCAAVINTCMGLPPYWPSEPPCDFICPDFYRPVCAKKGASLLWYANTCWLRKCECQTSLTLEIVGMDDCDSLATPPPRNRCPPIRKQRPATQQNNPST